MKQWFAASAMLLVLLVGLSPIFAQDKVTTVALTPKVAKGLDLKAVGELFKNSENLEAFEKALNDPEVGVNNLDLDENGEVDYIRVVEQVVDSTHLVILQVPLGENEFQDVATIEVENAGGDQYNMQVHGNEVIYGPHYYVATPDIYVYRWPIITLMYGPLYRPYLSVFRFGYYPPWWRVHHPVTVRVYRTRVIKVAERTTFAVTKTTRVKSVTKVNYTPRTSTVVTKNTKVTRSARGATTVKREGDRTVRTKGERKKR
jgi:hypothetical protein